MSYTDASLELPLWEPGEEPPVRVNPSTVMQWRASMASLLRNRGSIRRGEDRDAQLVLPLLCSLLKADVSNPVIGDDEKFVAWLHMYLLEQSILSLTNDRVSVDGWLDCWRWMHCMKVLPFSFRVCCAIAGVDHENLGEMLESRALASRFEGMSPTEALKRVALLLEQEDEEDEEIAAVAQRADAIQEGSVASQNHHHPLQRPHQHSGVGIGR